MLTMLIMLFFAKIQDTYAEKASAAVWAAVCAVVSGLMMLVFGDGILAALIGAVFLWLYCWGYFALLRRVTENLLMWLPVYFGGVVLPLVLLVGLAGK